MRNLKIHQKLPLLSPYFEHLLPYNVVEGNRKPCDKNLENSIGDAYNSESREIGF